MHVCYGRASVPEHVTHLSEQTYPNDDFKVSVHKEHFHESTLIYNQTKKYLFSPLATDRSLVILAL